MPIFSVLVGAGSENTKKKRKKKKLCHLIRSININLSQEGKLKV